jgi:hypothetical protein
MLVSDAQLLAPEEIFTGEGVVKAEAELSRDERRRRRARKKEKAKSILCKANHLIFKSNIWCFQDILLITVFDIYYSCQKTNRVEQRAGTTTKG